MLIDQLQRAGRHRCQVLQFDRFHNIPRATTVNCAQFVPIASAAPLIYSVGQSFEPIIAAKSPAFVSISARIVLGTTDNGSSRMKRPSA
jgi:hypothetical protein